MDEPLPGAGGLGSNSGDRLVGMELNRGCEEIFERACPWRWFNTIRTSTEPTMFSARHVDVFIVPSDHPACSPGD